VGACVRESPISCTSPSLPGRASAENWGKKGKTMGYVCAESEALVRPGTGLADSTGKGGGGGRARYGCGRMVDIHAPTRYARRWLAITDKTHSVGYPYSSTATPGITARRRECRSAALCCGGQYINRPGPPTRGSATDNSFVHTTPDPTQRTWASLCAHLYPTFAATISFRDG